VAEALENLYSENEEEKLSSIYDLRPKMRLNGTVTRVELFGAFVDLGVDREGLVHISQLSARRVNRVNEVVNEGDQVTVWVTDVDPQAGRISLTMIEPPGVDWDEIHPDQVYTGKVKRIERFGAFIDIGATRDGLVHVSEITTSYIQDPKEYLKVGDEVQVKVLKVDRKRRRIELSIKALEDYLEDEDKDEELGDEPTAMEFAWRQAQSGRKKRRGQPRRKKGQFRGEQDDVFTRTLRLQSDRD
jgi:small subunit ribosomal protein S1